MSESIIISSHVSDKKAVYEEIIPQIDALIAPDNDLIASLANISAILKEVFQHHWVGFYRVKNHELILGPFQGPLACTVIAFGKGVCGTAWKEKETIVVDDVHQFPGHIACSSLSNAEIVVPIKDAQGEVQLVLDVDSIHFHAFDEDDKAGLEKISDIISKYYFS
jgi:L-methionine (R)-S-oxide reductase